MHETATGVCVTVCPPIPISRELIYHTLLRLLNSIPSKDNPCLHFSIITYHPHHPSTFTQTQSMSELPRDDDVYSSSCTDRAALVVSYADVAASGPKQSPDEVSGITQPG